MRGGRGFVVDMARNFLVLPLHRDPQSAIAAECERTAGSTEGQRERVAGEYEALPGIGRTLSVRTLYVGLRPGGVKDAARRALNPCGCSGRALKYGRRLAPNTSPKATSNGSVRQEGKQ